MSDTDKKKIPREGKYGPKFVYDDPVHMYFREYMRKRRKEGKK